MEKAENGKKWCGMVCVWAYVWVGKSIWEVRCEKNEQAEDIRCAVRTCNLHGERCTYDSTADTADTVYD